MAGWTKGKPRSVEDYLSKLDPDRRATLDKLRGQILKVEGYERTKSAYIAMRVAV